MISYKERKGPKKIPVIGNLHQIKITDMHNQLERWAEEFGYVYKFQLGGTKLTVVTDPEMIQEILKNRPEGFRRMQKMDIIFSEIGMKGVFNVEGEEWYKHRKLIAKGLDIKHQQHYFPAIITSAQRLLNKWNVQTKSETYNIQEDFLRFTVDVTTNLAFGYDMNTLEQEGDVIQNHLGKIFPMIFKRINSPISTWKYYKTKKDKEFENALKEIDKFIQQLITEGKERFKNNPNLKENPTNILEALLVAADEDKSITDYEVKGNLLTILMAGEDTTAYTLAWAVFYLSKYPEIQQELRKDINDLLGEEKYITDYEQLSKLEKLDALIFETMRLKPVAPLLLLQANEDITVKEHIFHKGDNLVMQSRYACKHAEHFFNAKEFDLNRWLDKPTNKPVEGHNIQAYMPFGSGPRFCPGKNLAQLELRMVLSLLIRNFQVELVTPEDQIQEIKAFTMMPSKFNIKITSVT